MLQGLLQMPLVFRDSGVCCSFQRDWGLMGNDKRGTSVNTIDEKRPSSPPTCGRLGLLAPPSAPGGNISFKCDSGFESILCPHPHPGVDKCKVLQGDTCTCSWDPGSLSEGAFKWIKPFSCWRLNALRDLWLDNPELRKKTITHCSVALCFFSWKKLKLVFSAARAIKTSSEEELIFS